MIPSAFYDDPEIMEMLRRRQMKGLSTRLDNIQLREGIQGEPGTAGPQGERGIPGENGKDGTNGKDGKNGRNGVDGSDGRNGISGKNGKDGTDGKNGIDAVVKYDQIIDDLIEKIKKEKPLDISHIRNSNSFLFGGTRYKTAELMHGAGTGGSGSTLTPETPSGAVDDSNVTFTVTNEPLYIVVNGGQYTVGTGIYQSYVAGTITLTAPVGDGGFITSYYNA